MYRIMLVDDEPNILNALRRALSKLGPDALTPVQVMCDVLTGAIRSGELPKQSPDLATALVFGVVLEPAQFSAYGQLPVGMVTLANRLAAAAWAAVTTV